MTVIRNSLSSLHTAQEALDAAHFEALRGSATPFQERIHAIRPQPGERILEVGAGSGYQAAVLAQMGADVYTIEIVEPLAEMARQTLERLGYKNAHVKHGDGYRGWPERAPFDAVIVTCAPDKIPPDLIAQIKDGGRMIIPVGGGMEQELILLRKRGERIEKQSVLPVRFVPMTGEAEKEN